MLPLNQWIIVSMILALTMFVGRAFDSWPTVFVLFVLAMLGLRVAHGRERRTLGLRQRIEGPPRPAGGSWRRSFVLVVLFGLVLVVVVSATRWVPYLTRASFNPLDLGADVLAHAALTTILILWVIGGAQGHPVMLGLGMSIVLLTVAVGGASQSITGQTTVAFCVCTGFLFSSQAILGSGKLSDPNRSVAFTEQLTLLRNSRWRRVSLLFSALTLSSILITTGMVARATNDSLPDVQRLLQSSLKDSLDHAVDQLTFSGTRYVRGATLGAVRRDMMSNPEEIALRVFADQSPGYLRGTAFDFYSRRNWYPASRHTLDAEYFSPDMDDTAVEARGRATTELRSGSRSELRRFQIEGAPNDVIGTIEVRNIPMKGNTVFMPLASNWIEARSGRVTLSRNRTVRHGVNVLSPYVLGVARTSETDAMSETRRRTLLSIPENLRAVVEPLAQRLCEGVSEPRDKAKRVAAFFQSTFSYSLDLPQLSQSQDPIRYFLENEHPAHCELFASATAMLLRAEEVPTRYVTGYVVSELHEDQVYWVARNRDAHAWVEAYDERSQVWFPVEATPGRQYRTVTVDESQLSDTYASGQDGDDEADFAQSWLSSTWAFLATLRASNPLLKVFQFAQGPLFLLVSVLLWKRYQIANASSANPVDILSRKMLRQVDRRMKRASLVRQGNETMHQFAARIENTFPPSKTPVQPCVDEVADWYRRFAEARYRGETPEPFTGAPPKFRK
ncbi:transglutaminase-like domain-containing protein [Novipirellula artificiosorum]|uniref:Protein-glutamine gamma-glutamyltransferase n=1 Tax=Novipirellula artificiosorum TaxID=2528016 RepID=A0A5C6DEM1_9BACT|nr:transglutaminase-like domain-containing protein [Novipirellula artificiosorum]TWU34374.1 Protein-glutamine gamma-glutamyltransferase [Novipirellula artificiosorum]